VPVPVREGAELSFHLGRPQLRGDQRGIAAAREFADNEAVRVQTLTMRPTWFRVHLHGVRFGSQTPRLCAIRETEEPREECGFVDEQFAARRFKDGAGSAEAVLLAIS
jgi:hypothetical protein